MPGMTSDQKKDRLSRISYKDFLLNIVKVDPGVIPYYQKRTHGLYGVGIDAVAALEVWPGYPGFQGLNLEPGPHPRLSFTAQGRHVPKSGPYNYQFPDGNASVARALMRSLIPDVAPGTTAESVVTAKFDYAKLDNASNQIRVRLSSTVLRTRHLGKPSTAKREVEVVYGREKQLYTVRAKSVVLACWNMMIPYVCEDLPAPQKEALKYGGEGCRSVISRWDFETGRPSKRWESAEPLPLECTLQESTWKRPLALGTTCRRLSRRMIRYLPEPVATPISPGCPRAISNAPATPNYSPLRFRPSREIFATRWSASLVQAASIPRVTLKRSSVRTCWAARLRLRIPTISRGSRVEKGRVPVRNCPQTIRPNLDRKSRCRRCSIYRSSHGSGVSSSARTTVSVRRTPCLSRSSN